MKKIYSLFSDLKKIFTFKRGFIFGLYYWIMSIYELVFILLPFSRIIGYPSHSKVIDNAYKIYNSNYLILVTIFFLIVATLIFTKFNFADIGAMVWNAILLILFMLFIFMGQNTGTGSNIIFKAVLSLGTIESLIKNIFNSREAQKNSKQKLEIDSNWAKILCSEHEIISNSFEKLSLENEISKGENKLSDVEIKKLVLKNQNLSLKNQSLILQSRIDILNNRKVYKNNKYIKKPILNRMINSKDRIIKNNADKSGE